MAETRTPSLPQATAALLGVEPDGPRRATCPLCHTTDASVPQDALEAGGSWRCARCGQHWDAERLATVAVYAAWVVEHENLRARHRVSGSLATHAQVHPFARARVPSAAAAGAEVGML